MTGVNRLSDGGAVGFAGTVSENRIRVGPATDFRRFLDTDLLVWFQERSTVSTQEQLAGLPEDQRFAADVDGSDPATYPGVYGVFPLTLAVPGPPDGLRQVPCAGLTWVGVHPDHRRQGVLTAMMRHHFEQVREDADVHVSALHASEPAIYGRYGYGLASLELEVSLGRGTKLTAPHLEEAASGVTTQLAEAADAGTPNRLRACHLATPELGGVVGERAYYYRICNPMPEQMRDKEPWRVLFARRDGADAGFALFSRSHKWEQGRPAGALTVRTLVGDPGVRLALLRRLVDFDLMGIVRLQAIGVEDPMLAWAGGPRATAEVDGVYDSLWIRLVDLPEALQDRAWSAPCDVVVEVSDTTAPWNAGSWRICADASGTATVERSSAEPDLALGVDALGGAYAGGGNLVALHRAGLIAERRRGAVSELWRAMRTDVAPTAAVMF